MIEPVTGFATIVGLLHSFMQMRSGREDADAQEFLNWLGHHKHEVVRKRIEENRQLLEGIQNLINRDGDLFSERFDKLESILSSIASKMEGFADVAGVFMGELEISEQANSILRQFVSSEGEMISRIRLQGYTALYVPEAGQYIEYEQDRFLEDDLNKLCDYGFLTYTPNAKGEARYRITRRGVAFIEAQPEL